MRVSGKAVLGMVGVREGRVPVARASAMVALAAEAETAVKRGLKRLKAVAVLILSVMAAS